MGDSTTLRCADRHPGASPWAVRGLSCTTSMPRFSRLVAASCQSAGDKVSLWSSWGKNSSHLAARRLLPACGNRVCWAPLSPRAVQAVGQVDTGIRSMPPPCPGDSGTLPLYAGAKGRAELPRWWEPRGLHPARVLRALYWQLGTPRTGCRKPGSLDAGLGATRVGRYD